MGIIKQKITLLGMNNQSIDVTALIDTGAETSFITTRLAKKLGLIPFSKVSTYLADGTQKEAQLTSGIIQIKSHEFSILLAMTDSLGEDELIIGADFMQDKNYILSMKKDKLVVKEPKYNYKGYRL